MNPVIARVPSMRDHVFLIRFLVLFAIWVRFSYAYCWMFDQTIPALVTSVVFFGAMSTAFIGFWTRLSMVVLGLSMIAHAYLSHGHVLVASALPALLPLLAAMLPIGDYYSLDRYLQTNRDPVPYRPSAAALAKPLPGAMKALIVAVLAFNIGTPAIRQIFHGEQKMLRAWDMYHLTARDLVNLRFYRGNDPATGYVDYMKVLGHHVFRDELVRSGWAYRDRLIIGFSQLDDVITRVCAAAPDPVDLRLNARITVLKRGWLPIYQGDAICDAQGHPVLKTYPEIDEPQLGWGDEGEAVEIEGQAAKKAH